MSSQREEAFAAHRRGDLAAAEHLYRKLIQTSSSDAELQHYLGALCFQTGRVVESVQWLQSAAALKPQSLPTLQLLIRATVESGDSQDALAALEQYLALRPLDAAMNNLRGQQLVRLGRLSAAEASFSLACQQAGKPTMYRDLGLCRQMLGNLPGAVTAFQEALKRGAADTNTRLWLAQCLRATGRVRDYYDAATEAARVAPDDAALAIEAQSARRYVCDWDGFDENQAALLQGLGSALRDADAPEIPPGVLNYLEVDETTITAAARRYAQTLAETGARIHATLPARGAGDDSGRIRLGYLSTDFFAHAVGHLVRDLFAAHDRARFEVYGYSLRHQPDSVQNRIQQGFDYYRNLSGHTPEQIARAIRADQIDILIDLAGYTSAAHPSVLAARIAPVQISWLGYLGTSGGDFIDYIIADDVVLPPGVAQHYTERVIRLPHFLVASPLSAAGDRPAREVLGLEQRQFIFCSFNQAYKLDRRTFAAWMQILSAVPESILWMYVPDSELCAANLLREAGRFGIAPQRLVFAGREQMASHVARLSAADLALDPFHISGGATTVAALAAGLPVLSCRGDSFLSRIGSAINMHLGIPEMDCETPEQYVAKAVELASTPILLSAVRDRLKSAIQTMGYFDVPRFVRTLETGLETVWQRHRAGGPPDNTRVS